MIFLLLTVSAMLSALVLQFMQIIHEEFVEGEIVSTTSSLNYTNKGETLDPYKTKQTEFGIR